MNTKCQIQIVEEWSDSQKMYTFYRNSNGHPDFMIPLIYRAWIQANDEYFPYRVGRAMVAEEMVWWAGHGEFKREDCDHLHRDTQYRYLLHCWYSNREEQPIWEIDVYERRSPVYNSDFILVEFRQLENRKRIEKLIKKYEAKVLV